MSEATRKIVDKIIAAFEAATTADEYRAALRRAKRLPRQYHLEAIDALRFAAFRLDLHETTGTPKLSVLEGGARRVQSRGEITGPSGKSVVVEVLQ